MIKGQILECGSLNQKKGVQYAFCSSQINKLLMEVLDCLLKRKRQMGPLLIRVGLMAWQRERENQPPRMMVSAHV
jgi:hypothetical protein